MDKSTMYNMLVRSYCELAYTDRYILGFYKDGLVYMATVKDTILKDICCLDRASRGAGYSLRYKPNKSNVAIICENALDVIPLCSKEFFMRSYKHSKYNKGETFERLVYKYYGRKWHKDTIPFYKNGDISINDISYQIKFIKATLTTEKQINGLRF